MDIIVYLPPNLTIGRDVIEDEIEAAIGVYGYVTGAGSGTNGSNIDTEILDPQDFDRGLEAILDLVRRLKLPQETYLVANGKRQSV